MQNEKPFKTVDEQVEILKSRNLIFLDEHRAKEVLTFYGYYEIINGYKDHFMLNDDNDEYGFKKGMTFENIYALYQYDKNIRDGVRIVMENFEQNFKQVISNVVSSNISEMFNIYSAEENFNSGKVYRNHHTDRSNLIHKMNKIKCSNRQPFKYYMENHGNVPPWILCKGLTFGQTIYWFSLSKNEIKNKIISDMLGINTELIENFDDEFKIKQSFSDMLELFLDYRNISSHCGRTFNHRSKIHRIRNYSPYIYKNIINISKSSFHKEEYRSSLGLLVNLLTAFSNNELSRDLDFRIKLFSVNYLSKYPDDYNLLIESMELKNSSIDKFIRENIEKNKKE